MKDVGFRFWLWMAVAGGVVGAGVAVAQDLAVLGVVASSVVGMCAAPLVAFILGAAFFTVREERRNFSDRHSRRAG